jgi:phage tail sheath gpL-like
MAAEAFRAYPYGKFTLIAADDLVAGVAATGSLLVTGPTTESGTIALFVDGTMISVGVTKNDAASAIAVNIANQINANPDLPLSVPVAPTTGTVALVARHKGECGNEIDVRHSFYTGQKAASRHDAGCHGDGWWHRQP